MNRKDFDKIGLPSVPGIYFFRDEKGEILYIGKATSLKERVRSYFSADLIATRGPRLVDMVFKAVTINWEVCQNALEALIIEANEIRKHNPKYNSREKDDKSYNCVVITKEEFPRVFLVRSRDIDRKNKVLKSGLKKFGAQKIDTQKLIAIFGPYPSGTAIKEGLKILRKIFPFRDISSSQKDKEIFYRQIGLSPDLSTKEAEKKYLENIKRIRLFLSGKFKQLRFELKKQMEFFAKKEEFEFAEMSKNKLFALDHIQDIALLKRDDRIWNDGKNKIRFEAYDIAHISGTNMVGVMVVAENGVLQKDEYRKFNIKTVKGANDTAALKEVISRRLKHPEWNMPTAIVVDGNKVQKKFAEEALKEAGISIPVLSVVKNEKHKPKGLLGIDSLIIPHKQTILLVNGEAHRFAIDFHRKKRNKSAFG